MWCFFHIERPLYNLKCYMYKKFDRMAFQFLHRQACKRVNVYADALKKQDEYSPQLSTNTLSEFVDKTVDRRDIIGIWDTNILKVADMSTEEYEALVKKADEEKQQILKNNAIQRISKNKTIANAILKYFTEQEETLLKPETRIGERELNIYGKK